MVLAPFHSGISQEMPFSFYIAFYRRNRPDGINRTVVDKENASLLYFNPDDYHMAENTVETELVKLARSGDEKAFSELVSLYRDKLFGIAAGLCSGLPAEADDVAQETMISAMLLATLSVTVLIALALGIREALVVLVAVPVTLGLTLLVYFLAGYTLNRITLFALIFSIGILVDDAIVVVENIHRHWTMNPAAPKWETALKAVDEVGNPTILATLTVIAAILPMAFVSGMLIITRRLPAIG